MQKSRLAFYAMLTALALGLGILIGLLAQGWLGLLLRPQPIHTTTLLQQVQTLSRLVTIKYVLERIVPFDDPPKALYQQFLGQHNRIILIAHGVVTAGIDFQKLRPEDLQVDGKKITIHLPPAQLFDVYLDEEKTQVLEWKTALLRSFDKELEQTVRRNAVDDFQRAARRGGILGEAEKRAREQLTPFFRQLGFEVVEYR